MPATNWTLEVFERVAVRSMQVTQAAALAVTDRAVQSITDGELGPLARLSATQQRLVRVALGGDPERLVDAAHHLASRVLDLQREYFHRVLETLLLEHDADGDDVLIEEDPVLRLVPNPARDHAH